MWIWDTQKPWVYENLLKLCIACAMLYPYVEHNVRDKQYAGPCMQWHASWRLSSAHPAIKDCNCASELSIFAQKLSRTWEGCAHSLCCQHRQEGGSQECQGILWDNLWYVSHYSRDLSLSAASRLSSILQPIWKTRKIKSPSQIALKFALWRVEKFRHFLCRLLWFILCSVRIKAFVSTDLSLFQLKILHLKSKGRYCSDFIRFL